MAIAITEEVERIVKEKVASGEYATGADVLMAALHLLEAQDVEIAAIEVGIADVRAGRTQPLEEVKAELREEFSFLKEN
jgi:Arc/MetJ-type ribon-helix-helix transcriptional regulator